MLGVPVDRQWVYMIHYISSEYSEVELEYILDGYGDMGWELVAVSNGIMYFKKPKNL